MAVPLLTVLFVATAWGSPTEVVRVVFTHRQAQQWRVDVTLRHADEGWEHYANVWVVETPGGERLGKRTLFHPHVNEQPFTRSTTVDIPAETDTVRVRAGDNVNGFNSNVVTVNLRAASGDRFEVRR